ncbi:MAG: sensor histidine kinase, partial [Ginsengibacter sp.]
MIYIPVSVFSAYISAYFLLPRFILRGKYFSFFISAIILFLINLSGAYLLTKALVQLTQKIPFNQLPLQIKVFDPIVYGVGLGTAASGFAIIVKLLKYRYLKQKENERLQKQKINTELQMIKTNFHPHFLSDALKNIADLIRKHSTQSPAVILSLSDLLSYILYDNEKNWVPMEQELQMVKAYFNLEKIFYANRIIINMDQQGDVSEMRIAPLVILSLIQNTCEKLLLSLQQKLTINISIKAENNRFFFEMACNGYYDTLNGMANQKSALRYALQRIQVLYAGKHLLETNSDNGFFSIQLVLEPEAVYIK